MSSAPTAPLTVPGLPGAFADRKPPYSLEAEMSVLGGMLLDADAIAKAIEIVDDSMFHREGNRRLFRAVTRLWERGDVIDVVTLSEELKNAGDFDAVGGPAYLAQLLDAVPTAANIEYHAKIVREKALLRRLIEAATSIIQETYENQGDVDQLLDTAEQRVFQIAQQHDRKGFVWIKEILWPTFEKIEALQANHSSVTGVPTGFHDLDELTAGFQPGDLIIVAARPSMGKCLAHDAEIVLDDGSVATIAEIGQRRQARLLTLGDDWTLRLTEPSAFFDDGVKPVYRVRTRLGRNVETTLTHPFLTLQGWRRLEELRVGERVAVPREIPIFGQEPMRECEVKLLAYLLGDGCLTDTTPEFTSGDARLREDFAAACAEFGGLRLRGEANGGRTPTLHVARDAGAAAGRENPLTGWLRALGVWGCGAHAKHVPAPVFQLPRAQLALFLNRLFATDGWATVLASGQPQVGYSTVSEQLARQVQHLLLRFGVVASLRERAIRYRDGRRTAWQLDVTDAASLAAFAGAIGLFGKEEALARVERALRGRRRQTNRDLVPVAVWDRLAAAKGARSWASVGRAAGARGYSNLHVGRRGLSRPRLLALAGALHDEGLQQLARSDVYWDEIVAIEPAGEKQVYDLTIPETHNFVANDVCVHNTAFTLNVAQHAAISAQQCVAFFSLEMSKEALVQRVLCAEGRVDASRLRRGRLHDDEYARLATAAGYLNTAPIFIDDSPGISVLEMRAKARRLKADRPDLSLVIVDYLQLMQGSGRSENRQQEVSDISRGLKALAKELNVPVVALSQLSRAVEQRPDKRPMMSDLRESGAIEQDADLIMFLYRPEYYFGPVDKEGNSLEGRAELIVGKQRNGATGKVDLVFLKEFTRFESFSPRSDGM